jgi:hypothetical protein
MMQLRLFTINVYFYDISHTIVTHINTRVEKGIKIVASGQMMQVIFELLFIIIHIDVL